MLATLKSPACYHRAGSCWCSSPTTLPATDSLSPDLTKVLSARDFPDQITDEVLYMRGWELFVLTQPPPRDSSYSESDILARWMTGINGLEWLSELVTQGRAQDLGGEGYPCSYSIAAGVLAEALSKGIPKNHGPEIIGDDYVMPAGWAGSGRIDLPRLQALEPTQILSIEAWDQS